MPTTTRITTTIAISFSGLLLDFGDSDGFGVVSIFFLGLRPPAAFGIKIVSGIYIPIINKDSCDCNRLNMGVDNLNLKSPPDDS